METDHSPRVFVHQDDELDISMNGDPAEVRRVRRAVSEALSMSHVAPERLQDTLVVVSELVSNAIVHGGPPRNVRVSLAPRGLLIQVFDGSPRPPQLVEVAGAQPGGRGLQLVAQLAREWGTTPCPDGKWVWCVLALQG